MSDIVSDAVLICQLREALADFEWDHEYNDCSFCRHHRMDGHADDCDWLRLMGFDSYRRGFWAACLERLGDEITAVARHVASDLREKLRREYA